METSRPSWLNRHITLVLTFIFAIAFGLALLIYPHRDPVFRPLPWNVSVQANAPISAVTVEVSQTNPQQWQIGATVAMATSHGSPVVQVSIALPGDTTVDSCDPPTCSVASTLGDSYGELVTLNSHTTFDTDLGPSSAVEMTVDSESAFAWSANGVSAEVQLPTVAVMTQTSCAFSANPAICDQ